MPPVAVELTRGEIVESRHRAFACVATADGELLLTLGDPDFTTFLRSSAKPLQAVAAVASGAVDAFGLTERELAIIAGSHGGEAIHTGTVATLLAKGGLEIEMLQCGIQPPLDTRAREELAARREEPTALHHNCSGKHAGMLLTAKHLGLDIHEYLNPEHPVQKRITEVIARLGGAPAESIATGVDGCSAPVHAMPMRAAARAFARMVEPDGLTEDLRTAAKRVTAAMRAYPQMVAATRDRICTELMRAGEAVGLIAKAGAEGYYAAGWRDIKSGRGLGLAVKMEDGMQRGRDPLAIAILQRFGALPLELPGVLLPFAAGKIKNWRGLTVGEMRVILV